MKGQKASRVDLVEKKIKALINVMQKMMDDIAQLKELSNGTLETVKLMPDFQEALDKLKENLKKEEEVKDDGSN
jgi:hypothetical protein